MSKSKSTLPIGIQEFEKIITHGLTYIDKTQLIYQLATRYDPYFLSRPRRFGKSLLVSTLDALFSGRRDLFKGLWIDKSDWDWIQHPIIRLDMSSVNNQTPEMLERALIHALNKIAAEYSLHVSGETSADVLSDLIEQMALTSDKKVVVLIDEYDKPLIDHVDDLSLAEKNRRILRQFFTPLKSLDKHLRFIFLTGVTKFSKVSVFSGLNNLNDLSLSNEYSTLLGITGQELKLYFADAIQEIATANELSLGDCYARIKEWYNGYRFSKSGELVYNPFSTLKMLDSKEFSAYWFETGTPAFLINLLKKRHFDLSNLEQINVSMQSFSSFDIEDLPTLPLLYQTGYLTIKSILPHIDAYCLGFPNREVSQSFSESLLTTFASSKVECSKLLVEIATNLYSKPWDPTPFFEIIQKLLSLIPYDLYVRQEKYFSALFYLIIKLAGFKIGAEIHTQQGRADAILEVLDKTIVFEFKMDETAQKAIDQIKQKKYYQSYEDRKLPIYLVGINFNSQKRTVDGWLVEEIGLGL